MDLDREAQSGPREDDGSHDQVVREGRVRLAVFLDHLAHGGDVRVQVAVELLVGQLGEGLHLETLVAVGDEYRQEAADVGDVHRDVLVGPNPVELVGAPVLAEQVDLVPLAASAWARLAL